MIRGGVIRSVAPFGKFGSNAQSFRNVVSSVGITQLTIHTQHMRSFPFRDPHHPQHMVSR